ncbi:MAG: hypothetical protein ACLQU5_07790 [Isosphaeraceae bacterium]
MNRPDLTIAAFERLIDRRVPVPMIGGGMPRFHVRRHDHRASCDRPRILSHEGPAGLIASHRANRG